MRSRNIAATLMLAVMLAAASIFVPAFASQPAPPAPQAAQPAPVNITLDGVVQREGKPVSIDNIQVRPGEVITWNLHVVNRGNQGVSNVRADGLIPKGTRYVPGSAVGAGVVVQYSIDGGRSFSARPMVMVEGKERPASPDTYTNVRFTWPAEIRPGDSKAAHYRTSVR